MIVEKGTEGSNGVRRPDDRYNVLIPARIMLITGVRVERPKNFVRNAAPCV
jgi:hypothetical protein